MKISYVLIILLSLMNNCNENKKETNKAKGSSDLEYWSSLMKMNSSDEQLNSFSFEEKYKIIEYAYNKIGISSNYSFEQISSKLKNESTVGGELFNEKNQINRLAYWILGLWGSNLNLPQTPEEKFNYVKLSNQIWFFEGEQGDLNYQEYVNILHKMRPVNNTFSNWSESFNQQKNNYEIDFEYNKVKKHWDIENEVGGSINNRIFILYSDLCKKEYVEKGNYYLLMEGGGGIAMFLSYEAEEYLRTLWDFPKLNKKGKMMTIKEYGKL